MTVLIIERPSSSMPTLCRILLICTSTIRSNGVKGCWRRPKIDTVKFQSAPTARHLSDANLSARWRALRCPKRSLTALSKIPAKMESGHTISHKAVAQHFWCCSRAVLHLIWVAVLQYTKLIFADLLRSQTWHKFCEQICMQDWLHQCATQSIFKIQFTPQIGQPKDLWDEITCSRSPLVNHWFAS
jgi:hypothetical protein